MHVEPYCVVVVVMVVVGHHLHTFNASAMIGRLRITLNVFQQETEGAPELHAPEGRDTLNFFKALTW